MPKLNEYLFGKKGKIKQLDTLDVNQKELLALINQGLTSGEGALKDVFGGFNQQDFDQGVTQPALKNFQENILPGILEKFSGSGQAGGSGMRRGVLKAGTDLQSKLAELMYQAKQDALKNKLAGLQTSLGTKTFENIYKPGTQGIVNSFVQGVAGKAGEGIGQSVSNFFSGGSGGGGSGGGQALNPNLAASMATTTV